MRGFDVFLLVWFFGWAFLSLKYPVQSFRFLSGGRTPTPKNLKAAKVVGYMGLLFGSLLLIQIVSRILYLSPTPH